MKGKFIVFEGIEGCGKTTQIKLVKEWLSSQWPHAVIATREPGGTKLGSKIRDIVLASGKEESISNKAELFLFAADRIQHIEKIIKPQLESGGIVLCDRFVDSTVTYQCHGRGISAELIEQINRLATNGLNSDLTFWLDVDVEVGLSRARRCSNCDRIDQESIDFHHRVNYGYAKLAKQNLERIIRIDGSLSIEAAFNEIKRILRLKLF
jgi:dTMP kinase